MVVNGYNLTTIIKLMIKYLLIFLILFMLLVVKFLEDMVNTPIHSLPITGDISIYKNEIGKLCFTPDFDSVVFNGESVDIEYIYLSNLSVRDISHVDNSTTNIGIWPKENNYILRPHDSICLDSNNPKFNQYVDVPLKPNSDLIVFISGEDSTRRHYVDFHAKFEYPYYSQSP